MKTGLKVMILVILVLAVSLGIFFIPGVVQKKGLVDVTMIGARSNFVGYDRYGRKLFDNTYADASTSQVSFTLSTDPGNGCILATNSKTSKVMTLNGDGKFLYDKSYTFEPTLSDGSKCSPIELKGLVSFVKKLKYRNFQYYTDLATKNVYMLDFHRLADPKTVKLSQPVQTAVFEDLTNWREYVIDRTGNKLVCFTPPGLDNGYDAYSNFQWVLPKGYEKSDAPAGSDEISFDRPTGVCVDGVGNVYVCDYGNDRVQKFEPDGTLMCTFPDLNEPLAVAANENRLDDKRIYVTNSGDKNVVVINTESGKVEFMITNDQFNVPSAITIGLDGSIWVGDGSSDKLFKFAGMDSENPGKLLLTVNDVVSSIKLQKNVVEVELKKYSAKVNGDNVKIKPYAQTVDKITYVPLRFMFDNLLNNPARADVVPASYEYDKETNSCTIKIGEFMLDDGSIYSEKTVKLTLNSDVATLNGQEVKLPGKVTNIAGSFFVPASSLKDLFDARINYKNPNTEPITRNGVCTLVFPPPK